MSSSDCTDFHSENEINIHSLNYTPPIFHDLIEYTEYMDIEDTLSMIETLRTCDESPPSSDDE